MEYRGILRERKPWVKVAVIVLALYMLYIEVMQGQYIYVPIMIFVIIAALMDREQIISEEGVDRRLMFLGHPIHNYWRWDEITAIALDYEKAKPNVQVLINKDVVIRSFVMKPSDGKAVVVLARKKNPRIIIEDGSKTGKKNKK